MSFPTSIQNISDCPTDRSHLEVELPLVLLVTESLYRRSKSIRNPPSSIPAGPSITHSSLHHWLVLGNNTTGQDLDECPILHTVIQAPGCAEYTRTQLTVDHSLARVVNTTYYTELNSNCSLSVGKLPPTIYLSHGANYSFSVIFYLRRMGKII